MPANLNKELIHKFLLKFPEVEWDRWSGDLDKSCSFFGWISREDEYKDFMLVLFEDGIDIFFFTSSAKHSRLFSEIMGLKHDGCERVEYLRFDKIRCLKLKK